MYMYTLYTKSIHEHQHKEFVQLKIIVAEYQSVVCNKLSLQV